MITNHGAVLTGDIIRSTRFDVDFRETIRDGILASHAVMQRSTRLNSIMPISVQTFRGDGWQLPLCEPSLALRVCLIIRALLRIQFFKERVDTRVCIGIGEIPPLHTRKPILDGEAYVLSGRGLDKMPKRGGANLIVRISKNIPKYDFYSKAINPMLCAVDYLVEKWTKKQAISVLGELDYSLQNISELSVNAGNSNNPRIRRYSLDRAGWSVIESVLCYFESSLQNL